MSITGEHIRSFQYVSFDINTIPSKIEKYLLGKIENSESKHVADFRDETKKSFEYSQKVKYQNTILGNHRNASIKNEYFRIQNMCHSACKRAARFVISKDARLWSDNTHWTLAYLLAKGSTTTLLDIPAYIIDFRENEPTVYDKSGVVFDSLFDIKNSIASAKRIQDRLDEGWRPIDSSYTIKQLYYDILSIIKE